MAGGRGREGEAVRTKAAVKTGSRRRRCSVDGAGHEAKIKRAAWDGTA